MKTNAEDYAFPDPASAAAVGLTKREYFAAAAMTGIVVPAIAGSHNNLTVKSNAEWLAKNAVIMADAIIAELNKEAQS